MFGESSDDANAAPPPQTYAARRRRGENAVLLQQQLEGFPLRMSGIDNSYKIDGDVLLVIHASIPPGVERPTLPRGADAKCRFVVVVRTTLLLLQLDTTNTTTTTTIPHSVL